MSKEKNIVEWFDPYDIKHVMAYKEVQDKGVWPKDFVPKEMVFPNLWFYSIAMKIVKCWTIHMISNMKIKL